MLKIDKGKLPVSRNELKEHIADAKRLFSEHDSAVLSRLDDIVCRLDRIENIEHRRDDWQIDCLLAELRYRFDRVDRNMLVHDVRNDIQFWGLYAKRDELHDDARKRFFHSIPKATGVSRLVQRGCLWLLSEFDAVCRSNGLAYWVEFGTLLGAVRHDGFIPWDDDVDVGMMRDDIRKLSNVLEGSETLRYSERYDSNVDCRQIRVYARDEDIPCFIDIFIHDYARGDDINEVLSKREEARSSLHSILQSDARYDRWKERVYLDVMDMHDTDADWVSDVFDDVHNALVIDGSVCDVGDDIDAGFIVFAEDNFIDKSRSFMCVPVSDMFPLCDKLFDGLVLSCPCNSEQWLDFAYGDWLSLPSDFVGHSHVGLDSRGVNALRQLSDDVDEGECVNECAEECSRFSGWEV